MGQLRNKVRQLLDTFGQLQFLQPWNNFGATVLNKFGQLPITVEPVWNNFGTALEQLWNNL